MVSEQPKSEPGWLPWNNLRPGRLAHRFWAEHQEVAPDLQACQTLLCPASCKGSHKHEAVLLHPWATAGAPRLSEPCGSGVVAFSFARTAWRSGWLLHANGLQRITWKLEISGGNQNCTFLVNKQLLPGQSSFYAVKHVKWQTNQRKKTQKKGVSTQI